METAHNLLIDYLWARNYTQVYVVPPSVVKGSRQRYRQSGARTDQSDAELLAHLLRTDQHRLQPWLPNSLLTPYPLKTLSTRNWPKIAASPSPWGQAW